MRMGPNKHRNIHYCTASQYVHIVNRSMQAVAAIDWWKGSQMKSGGIKMTQSCIHLSLTIKLITSSHLHIFNCLTTTIKLLNWPYREDVNQHILLHISQEKEKNNPV